jgi:ATP-dependent Clp protease ATP-binding subunit ClpC
MKKIETKRNNKVKERITQNVTNSVKGKNPSSSKTLPKKKNKYYPYRRRNILEEFTTNLTNLAESKKLDPVIGRDKEIERVVQVLSRRRKNNPLLIGEPGVGKTAVAEGLALKISIEDIPTNLRNKIVIVLDVGLLLACTKYRG